MDFDAATSADDSTDVAASFCLNYLDFCAFVEPLPRQPEDDCLKLFVRERHASIFTRTRADEAAS